MGGSPSGLSFASTSGSASGTTRTAVAEGQIEVRADALNGRDSTAGLSRDTAGANGSIGKIFDKDKVRESWNSSRRWVSWECRSRVTR